MSQALVALFFLFLFSLLILFYLEHETAMRQAGPNEKKKMAQEMLLSMSLEL